MTKRTMLGILLLVSLSVFTLAQNPSNATGAKHSQKPSQSQAFNRSLKSTTMNYDEPLVTVSADTFTNIDSPLSFTCPHGGCTLTADIHAQVGEGGPSFNEWAICALLDGNIMPPNACPYVGELATDGSFSASSFEFVQTGVTAGHHSIQSQIFMNEGGLLATYEITYRLYTP